MSWILPIFFSIQGATSNQCQILSNFQFYTLTEDISIYSYIDKNQKTDTGIYSNNR